MMRRFLLAVLFCAVAPLLAGAGVLLSPEEGLKVANQCSRMSPGPVQGTWQPTAAQIKELENRLPAEFRRGSQAQDRFPELKRANPDEYSKRLEVYFRQYAGLIIHQRKIIYLNAVRVDPTLDSNQPGWRTKAMLICDGGPITFGVEYDPSTKKFSHFAFNGAI